MPKIYAVQANAEAVAVLRASCTPIGCDVVDLPEGSRELELLRTRAALDVDVLGVFYGNVGAVPPPQGVGLFCEPLPSRSEIEAKAIAIIARALAARLVASQKYHAAAADSLSEVRALFEENEAAFGALESYVRGHDLIRPQTMLDIPPGLGSVRLAGGQTLKQALPHDAYGLCGITIHLATALESGTKIAVTLKLGHDVIEEWAIEGPRRFGSVVLGLSQSLREQNRFPSLEIIVAGEPRTSIFLALGEKRLARRWAAQLNGEIQQYPLAIALRYAPPGLGQMPRINQIRPLRDPGTSRWILVDDWAQAPFKKGPTPGGMITVTKDGWLQTHPFNGGATIAYLEDVDLSSWSRLDAEILLASEQSEPVAFALALAAVGHEPAAEDISLEWSLRHTGWIQLNGGEQRNLSLELGGAKRASVFMLCEMRGNRTDYAWAQWGPLTLEK